MIKKEKLAPAELARSSSTQHDYSALHIFPSLDFSPDILLQIDPNWKWASNHFVLASQFHSFSKELVAVQYQLPPAPK